MRSSILSFAVVGICWTAFCAAEPAPQQTSNQAKSDMGKFEISSTSWGKLPDGQEATLFTITNPGGMKVKLTNYGGHIVEVDAPDRDGKFANVVLGFDNLNAYVKHTAHFGSTIGRYGNRIAKGKFTLDGKQYTLETNNGPNHLHGGSMGFDHQLWNAEQVQTPDAYGVKFTYVSKDGEANYPGTLTATATYWLTKDNALKIDYTATTDKNTVVNLTNHAYWNLAGAGKGDILDQKIKVEADKYLAVDNTLIPTGEMKDVTGTIMDFTKERAFRPGVDDLKKQPILGYDHCYVLRNPGKVELAATARDPKSGRIMEVWTDQPGVQLYTGNHLDGGAINGGFPQYSAFCLETQHFPDSPNHPQFPSTVLKPGEEFKSTTVYKFKTE
jgi:aldose 1-epimerase